MNPKAIAIIPARSGSRGIPNKNIRPLLGKPLIAHSIETALQSKYVERVLVSTDSEAYAEVARQFGAEVPFLRPPEIAGDQSSSESALLHALEQLEQQGETLPEILLFIQCTSPLTRSEDLDRLVELLTSERADSAFTAVGFHAFLWKTLPNGQAEGINHDKSIRLMRQDRESEFRENGAVYAMRIDGFRKHQHRFFGKTIICEVPESRTWEIDTETDFRVIEFLMRQQQKSFISSRLPRQVEAIVFDFDGVFTDNRVWVQQDGVESVACNRSDGLGINRAKAAGLRMLILSKETNPVVSARAAKLDLEVIQGTDDKPTILKQWVGKNGLTLDSIAYLGNDLNDLGCVQLAGFGVAVADAYPQLIDAADLVLSQRGGHGAVRELIDFILEAKASSTS